VELGCAQLGGSSSFSVWCFVLALPLELSGPAGETGPGDFVRGNSRRPLGHALMPALCHACWKKGIELFALALYHAGRGGHEGSGVQARAALKQRQKGKEESPPTGSGRYVPVVLYRARDSVEARPLASFGRRAEAPFGGGKKTKPRGSGGSREKRPLKYGRTEKVVTATAHRRDTTRRRRT